MKQIINSYYDITWEQYKQLTQLIKDEDIIGVTALLTGSSRKEIENTPITEAPDIDLSWIAYTSFQAREEFAIDDKQYKIMLSPLEMSVQRYIDYNTMLSTDDEDRVIKCIATLIIDGEYDYQHNLQIANKCSVADILSWSNFFQESYRICVDSIQSFMKKETKRILKKNPLIKKQLEQSLKDESDQLNQ